MDEERYSGSCLCGTVRFEFRGPSVAFRYCHCSRCRKATGSAHAANLFVPAAQFSWLAGEGHVRRFDLPEAQRFAVAFCRSCGTRVPHVIAARNEFLIPAGVVDGELPMRPQASIFWASRACWYASPAELPRYDAYPE